MRFFGCALALAGTAALLAGGCSSKQGSTGGGGGGGLVVGDAGGTAYPTQNIGRQPRGVDGSGLPNARAGNVIENYRFLGYPEGDRSKGLQTVTLADFYDPTGAKYKVIHIIAAAIWCGPCNDETDALVSALNVPSTDLRSQGVVYLQALTEGASPNHGATQADLDSWMRTHDTIFTEVLDPEATTLGVFFDAAAVPFNADVDARSMELLQAGTGYEDPSAVQVWVDWVNQHPPAYGQ